MTYFSPKSFANFQIPATGRVVDPISENVVAKLNACRGSACR